MEAWYRNTFLWGQVNLTENDPETCDPEVWKDYWKRSEAEGVIINCSGIVSYYPSEMKGQYRAAGLKDRDYFGVWNQAARQAGLKVIARMDINTTTKELFDLHPEWYCRDQENRPVMSQGRYVACVNGGYYQEFVPRVFQEVIERYHPDGFADNSWAGPGMKTVCYCENCRKGFREAYGEELPEGPDWENPVYRRWIKWNFDLRVKNWSYFNEITRLAGGENCRWFGMINADPFATGGRFYDIKRLVEHAPFIFCDHQFRDGDGGFEQNALNGALLKLASDENVIVAESMAHYYKGMKTFRLSCAAPQEVRKWMMSGLAGGIAPWFHFVGGTVYDRRRLHISDDIFRWAKKNREFFSERKNLANIGVVWNQESVIYYGRDDAGRKSRACFKGVTEALSAAGISFLPVHADDIEKYGDRLEALILPNVAILSEKQENALIDWLNAGKHLILTDDTGLYDEEGKWKGPGELYRMLGISPQAETEGVSENTGDSWMVHDAHSYLEIQKDHPLFALTPDVDLLPFGGQLRRTVSDGTLEAVASFIEPFPIYPPEFSWIRKRSDHAAVYAGVLDSGAKVLYFPADIDRCYGLCRLPDHRRLLEAAVRFVMQERIGVCVKAPAHVECCAYEAKGGCLVHLVNLAGCRVPLGTLEENLPTGPVRVFVRLPETLQGALPEGKTEVSGLWSGEACSIAVKEGIVEMEVPLLAEQEMIFLKKQI